MSDGTLTVQRMTLPFIEPDFDPELHRYALNGKVLPSVTGIIHGARLVDTIGYDDWSRDRGSAVHKATQYLDANDLDESTVDPEIAPYLEGYKRFRRFTDITWDFVEQPMADRQGRFCGMVDRISEGRIIADIKTGAYQPWHALQLAAYLSMLSEPWCYERWGLYLQADGGYSLRVFPKTEYQRDLSVFLSALNIVNWRETWQRS